MKHRCLKILSPKNTKLDGKAVDSGELYSCSKTF